MAQHDITLTINGIQEFIQAPSNMTLLRLLRDQLGLAGAKDGCSTGECGACTVMMDGEPVNSCLVLAVEADGKEIMTVEGLAQDGELDPLQDAIMNLGATQCGYCTPGILLAGRALLMRNPSPSDVEIKDALRGNLCRCTGYNRIINAVKQAAPGG